MRRIKGSLTIETALVLPLFLSLTISLVSILEMMNLYARVEYALHETAKEAAVWAYPLSYAKEFAGEDFSEELQLPDESILNPLLSETVIRALFTQKFGLKNLNDSLIKNGEAGIFFFRSDVINDKGDIDLIVTYKVAPFFNLFRVGEMTFSNRVKMHSWIGFVNDENCDEEYVYITENGSVYHTHRDCTYLHLSIETVSKSELASCRNLDGKKYKACKKCDRSAEAESCEYVYITDYGEAYHTSISCSGLKRTIYKIKLSEVGGRTKCERCASYKRGEIKKENDEESGLDN